MSTECESPRLSRLRVVPTTLPKANDLVERWHRHHSKLPGGFGWFCMLAVSVDTGSVVGAVIAGRPTNRNNDDGQTVEVLRVATNGTKNACSLLLGASARAAKAIGAYRIITYTLDEEGGASLIASGWVCEKSDIQSWWTHEGSRTPAISRDHHSKRKVRWARHFRDPIAVASGESDIKIIERDDQIEMSSEGFGNDER
jgi:hypothetical protein